MKSKFIKGLITFSGIILPQLSFAQVPGEKTTFPLEQSFVLIVVAGSLIVIAGLIYVLVKNMAAFFKIILDKSKDNKIKTLLIIISIASLLPIVASAQDGNLSNAAKDNASWYSAGNLMFLLVLGVYVTLVIIVLWLSSYFMKMARDLFAKEVVKDEEQLKIGWLDKVLDSFNASVPLNKEKDVLLDHDYDGIKELDNSLPPWWLYGFYVTIIFAVVYMFYFHLGGPGLSSTEAYAEEVRIAKDQIALMNKGTETTVDESNVALLSDAASLSDAKSLYANVCAVCHGPEAQGGAGPNLTDKYWIHGGDINSIYKLIKTGVADKGMPQWGAVYKPSDIQKLTSFVLSLQVTNPPNPKAPQGTLYDPVAVKDSVVALVDSTSKK